MRVIITAQALTDIETIYNFYLPYSEKTAIRICKTIFEYTTILGSFPQMGVVEPLLTEKPGNYRCLAVLKCKCKIIYKVENNIVWVSSIWDCRRNPELLQESIR